MLHRRGFTLIELLIVVAIIAILAAIAVPNFLEAQVRSKVARARADQRSIATGLETFAVDWNAYPPCGYLSSNKPTFGNPALDAVISDDIDFSGWIISWRARLVPLTTPISYISSVFNDPFAQYTDITSRVLPPFAVDDFAVYQYCEDYWIPWPSRVGISNGSPVPLGGYVTADGSDVCYRVQSCGPDKKFNYEDSFIPSSNWWRKDSMEYDATNGTVSHGDILRYGPNDRGNVNKP